MSAAVGQGRPAPAEPRVEAEAGPSRPAAPAYTHELWIRVYDYCPHEGTRTDHRGPFPEGV